MRSQNKRRNIQSEVWPAGVPFLEPYREKKTWGQMKLIKK